jgi:hypothetical protein
MTLPDRKPSLKPYHRPRLRVYGDLNRLTLAVGMKGAPDGGPNMLMVKS